jgi:hypothetical protein
MAKTHSGDDPCNHPLSDEWGPDGPNKVYDCDRMRETKLQNLWRGNTFSGIGRRFGNVPPLNQVGEQYGK